MPKISRLLWFFLFTLLLLLALLWFLQTSQQPSASLQNGARLQWTQCWFERSWSLGKTTQCAYFYPSHAVEQPEHQRVRLPVVVMAQKKMLQANNGQLQKDPGPVLFLAGGPGSATALEQDNIETWWMLMDAYQWSSRLVLFDQRGTGMSLPELRCPSLRAAIRSWLNKPWSLEAETRQWYQAYQLCHSQLQTAGIQLEQYTTRKSTEDVRDLMALLDSQQWNLYSVSYGTRLALDIMRKYPGRIRSVILDSVYPPEKDSLQTLAFVIHNAFDNLFKGCAENQNCQQAYPQLEAHFYELLKRFAKQPPELLLYQGEEKEPLKLAVSAHRLLDMVFYALYSREWIEMLPYTLEAVWQGDLEALQALADVYYWMLMDESFSYATNLSVECHDQNKKLTKQDILAAAQAYPRLMPIIEQGLKWDPCRFWRSGKVAKDFHWPVESNIPTLILNGFYDPVTPAVWGEALARKLKNSYRFQFPDMGHAVISNSECGIQVAYDFIRNPHRKPDPACLETLEAPNFVTEYEDC
ncbi:alpha/beta hydrolase [Candidatus Venteria ishoeyi]|uniref:Proline iminopeptidase n=1 Tax=Candidatus Venteria ishoeyi TaxID=1899563 RepID=A0A1H6FFC2_9GAMM|nr:alpha/beta hydrolase [Candidatus Venteria ishoeyi]MDM8545871.1 alpha/beta hydrolase [Candidatus Venteria ishoeyi]SEH08333.1 Carboxylesterase A precursor [Candidatus Venteria ishoeyi]